MSDEVWRQAGHVCVRAPKRKRAAKSTQRNRQPAEDLRDPSGSAGREHSAQSTQPPRTQHAVSYATHLTHLTHKKRQIGGNWGALEALATPQRRAFRRPPPAPADQPGAAPPFAGQRAAPEEQPASHRIEHLSSLRTPRPSRIRFVTAGHPVPPLRLPCPEPPTRCSSRHPPPLQQPSVPSPSRAAQSPPCPSRSAARKSPVVLGAYRRGRHTAAESIPGI